MEKMAGKRIQRRSRGQKAVWGEREKRRLLQLGVCLTLFLTVFFAKGMDRLTELRSELTQVLRADADFEDAFASLGWSLTSGQSVGKSLESLWSNVFFPQERTLSPGMRDGPFYRSVRKAFQSQEGALALWQAGHGEKSDPEGPINPLALSGKRTAEKALSVAALQSAAPPESTPEPEVVHMDYTGPELPENTTMDRYALGLSETADPVEAAMTSGFGWREHPISGGAKFHYGVDLAVQTGTTVRAFAAGTVEYIGQSDIYGQYLQLDHGNGVASFYAHCSKLCVQQGQRVAAGEKVAESGATGEVTGPHLHFEMKKDGVRLNPAYYLELPT